MIHAWVLLPRSMDILLLQDCFTLCKQIHVPVKL